MEKPCSVCLLVKPLDRFAKKPTGLFGVQSRCKDCQREYRKAYYAANAAEGRAKSRAYHAANREEANARFAAARRKKYADDPVYRAERNAQVRDYAQATRLRVFVHYGEDPPRCVCCGEREYRFLTLDHINGGGGAHRKQSGSKGPGVFYWIIKNGFPEGYRVLCANCHLAITHGGSCPHQS